MKTYRSMCVSLFFFQVCTCLPSCHCWSPKSQTFLQILSNLLSAGYLSLCHSLTHSLAHSLPLSLSLSLSSFSFLYISDVSGVLGCRCLLSLSLFLSLSLSLLLLFRNSISFSSWGWPVSDFQLWGFPVGSFWITEIGMVILEVGIQLMV